MTAEARARLLAALSERGVTDTDYRKIEQARALVDEVNAALAGRGSGMVCAVTLQAGRERPVSVTALPAGEILETA